MEAITPPRIRRTEPKGVRRRQLIAATIDSIAELGFSGTTLSSVTTRAKLSRGIVNFHFKSKELLFVETLVFLNEEYRALWRDSLDNPDLTPVEKLLSLIDAHYHPSVCNRKNIAVWYAFYGEAKYRADYRNIGKEFDTERLDETVKLFDLIKQDGPYESVDTTVFAKSLEALIDGYWLNILLYPKLFTRAEAKTQTLEHVSAIFPHHFPGRTESRSCESE